MALGPLSNIPAAPPAPSPTRNVTGAQRAFFEAALGKLEAAAAYPPPVAPTAPVAEAPQPEAAALADAPKAAYRPGSLLDVRV
ncbi:MAG TPA: hypothetical protein VIJ94_14040 [Caulobacteraceae bacterium]